MGFDLDVSECQRFVVFMPAAFPISHRHDPSPRFMTTRWTMILQAGGEGDQRAKAMEQFCSAYWYPVYAFIRRQGNEPEDAQDLTQGFFAKLLQKEWLSRVERREARFSTWLLTLVKSHLIKEHERDTAQKRGGTSVPMSIELAQAEQWFGAEPATNESPERLFERRWALLVLDAALTHLREECHAEGKGRLFDHLSPFLSREPELGEYAAVCEALRMRENAVAVAVHRLRQRYRQTVRSEVAAGLVDASRLDEELQHLADSL